MRKRSHTESEMVKAVKQLESGVDAESVSRAYGISKATLYNWKPKYSGMDVSQVKRLHELEEENRRLKQMYANLALDNCIMKDVIEKNSEARGETRTYSGDISGIQREHHSGVRIMCFHKSLYYYRSRHDDSEVEAGIRAAAEYGDGFWKIYNRLRREGKPWNHKKVYRVYLKMRMNKKSRLRKRLPARVKHPLQTPEVPCDTWSLDFVSDKLESGRKFRVLNMLDDCTRQSVAMEISMSMPAQRVIKALEKTIWINGKSKRIRTDNGPEFISKELEAWCAANCVEHVFTQPGCLTQNSYVERLNGSYRRGVLDAYLFRTLQDVRDITERWQLDYNTTVLTKLWGTRHQWSTMK